MTLTLSKILTTRSIARPLCDSWASYIAWHPVLSVWTKLEANRLSCDLTKSDNKSTIVYFISRRRSHAVVSRRQNCQFSRSDGATSRWREGSEMNGASHYSYSPATGGWTIRHATPTPPNRVNWTRRPPSSQYQRA